MKTPRECNAIAVGKWVRANAGFTCLEIALYLGMQPALVRVALADGRKAGTLESRGITRGTKWYPVART